MYCPNRNCPSLLATGEPAEYRDGITKCAECGFPLTPVRPEAEMEIVDFEAFVAVYEIPSAGMVPFAESLLQAAGIRFFVKGIGSGLDFVSGPVKVYAEPERADEARELLKEMENDEEFDSGAEVEEGEPT